MAKNILVLTGSPRKGGNSDQLADAFIAGALKAGHRAVKCTTADKNIKGCIDCKSCFSTGAACSVDDDFNGLAPLVEEADAIVFATPLYWFTFPAQIKAAIDKFYSFFIANRPLKIKECGLLVCGGEHEESWFDGIVSSYRLIAGFLNWQDLGVIIVPGLHEKGDVLRTDGLARAEAFGRNIP